MGGVSPDSVHKHDQMIRHNEELEEQKISEKYMSLQNGQYINGSVGGCNIYRGVCMPYMVNVIFRSGCEKKRVLLSALEKSEPDAKR